MEWWVGAIAYPNAPSTAQPYIFQAANLLAAVAKLGGKPLAGPFATQAQAQAWANGAGASNFGAGKTNISAPTDTPVTSGIPGPGNPLTGVNAIGDFFQRLTQPSTWIRVGEFVAGGLLLYIGGSAALRGTAAGETVKRTAKVAKKVVK